MFSDSMFNNWIDRKYNIEGQRANTEALTGGAQAGLFNSEAETGRQRANTEALTGGAQAGYYNSEAALNRYKLAPASDAALAAFHQHAFGGNMYGNGYGFGAWSPPGAASGGTQGIIDVPQGPATQGSATSSERSVLQPAYHAKGTAAVKGMPHGKGMVQMKPKGTDTVPAMLTPDEAVLNPPAAELIGRDNIAAANAIGNHMAQKNGPQGGPPAGKQAPAKGMIPARGQAGHGAPKGPPGHFAGGAANVSPDWRELHTNSSGQLSETPYQRSNSTPGPDGPHYRRETTMEGIGRIFTGGGSNQSGLVIDNSGPPAHYAMGTACVKPQDFSKGTHMVGHGKSAKTPTKLDPAALVGLLGAMRGGGGMMPGGGGGAPPPAMS